MQTEGFVLVDIGAATKAFALAPIELSTLKADEVLIESEAFGLNYADVMARLGLYREAPPRPCVLGYELVGRVTEVGAAVDAQLIGQRVLAFTRFGAYARHAKTTANAIVSIGDMPAHEALPFATQGVTAHYMAEVLSPIQAHDQVLVHAAAGGVGSFLVQLAKRKGATVFAKVGSDSKKAYLESLGVDLIVNYKKEAYFQSIKTHLGAQNSRLLLMQSAEKQHVKTSNYLGQGGGSFCSAAPT